MKQRIHKLEKKMNQNSNEGLERKLTKHVLNELKQELAMGLDFESYLENVSNKPRLA